MCRNITSTRCHPRWAGYRSHNQVARRPDLPDDIVRVDDADHAARLFALQEFGNIYTRIMNPTTDVFEKRIAALRVASPDWRWRRDKPRKLWSSGTLASAGDDIVSTTSLYGGTYNLFHYTPPRLALP
jgi:O-acetylhomoserine (thiol)-lyase